MKLSAMVLLVSISAACVDEQQEVGASSQAVCVGPLTAQGTPPQQITFGPNTVLPVSTASQVWLMAPAVGKAGTDGRYASYYLFRIEPSTRVVINRYLVSKALRTTALAAAHNRFGAVIEARPPTNPPWPPIDEPTLLDMAATMGVATDSVPLSTL